MERTEIAFKEEIRNLIIRFVNESVENSLNSDEHETAWDKPLVGFSKGNDPLYEFFRKDIGEFYWHPSDIFSARFPDIPVRAEQLTVVSWVLPQTEPTKRDQRKERWHPSERWARSKLFGEEFNNKVRAFVANTLSDAGFPCLAPVLLPAWKRGTSEKYGYASTWSERHTAFICGLGTFGLSDGLITRLGKAVRFGSAIVRADIQPTARPYNSHQEYCLYYNKGKCGKCIERCPAGAISGKGHDKVICKEYVRSVATAYAEKKYGIRVNSCGLCQTGVPCESRIPGDLSIPRGR